MYTLYSGGRPQRGGQPQRRSGVFRVAHVPTEKENFPIKGRRPRSKQTANGSFEENRSAAPLSSLQASAPLSSWQASAPLSSWQVGAVRPDAVLALLWPGEAVHWEASVAWGVGRWHSKT